MYKIGQLVKAFDISRSTLLYYDKIGLLQPAARSDSNYRLYRQQDVDRLATISTYREAGLPLQAIAEILDSSASSATEVLEKRLGSLNSEISRLRKQQQLIVNLLGKSSLLRSAKVVNKSQWVNMLRAAGLDERAMRQWHIAFERDLPEAHRDFLESLGISAEEIDRIIAWSRAG